MRLRFKIDPNLPIAVAALLRQVGYEADTVDDEALGGAPDPDIAAVRRREQRALLTLDRGFSDIRTYPPAEYPGLVVLRPATQDKETVLRLVSRTLALFGSEPLAGTLWIVEEDRLRIRSGP